MEKKTGRPSKYETHVQPRLDEIREWYSQGMTDHQVAAKLGIAPSTLYEYKNLHPEFSDIVEEAKRIVDDMVESKLLELAMGFEYEEEAVTNKGDVVTVRRYSKPDIRAVQFWLKNRRPSEWRDKQDLQVEGNQTLEIVLDDSHLFEDSEDKSAEQTDE